MSSLLLLSPSPPPLRLCLLLGHLCRPCPTSWTEKYWFRFLALCLCPLVFFLLFFIPFRLVLSCRPSVVGPSPGHIIRLIVPADSTLVPSGFGLRPERVHDDFWFRFFFPFLVFFSFPLRFFPFLPHFCLFFCHSSYNTGSNFRVYACTTAMFLVLSRCKCYGIVHHSS